MTLAADTVVAFGAGVASFASPCVLPLVPAYLAVVGALEPVRSRAADAPVPALVGTSGGEEPTASAAPVRSNGLTLDTLLFVGGFTAVFVVLGLSANGVSRALVRNQAVLTRATGLFVVAMALFLAGSQLLRAPRVYGEWRLHPALRRFGRAAAPVAGAAFAFGWTPCVGPVLASILAVASTSGHSASAALQLTAYSAGLGVPFLAVAVFFEQLGRPLRWLRRRGAVITYASAGALSLLGLLLALDRLAWITTQVQRIT